MSVFSCRKLNIGCLWRRATPEVQHQDSADSPSTGWHNQRGFNFHRHFQRFTEENLEASCSSSTKVALTIWLWQGSLGSSAWTWLAFARSSLPPARLGWVAWWSLYRLNPLLMETSEDLGDQSLDCIFSYRPSSLVSRFPSALATADWSWALVHRGILNPHNFLGVWLVVILPWDGIECMPAFSDPNTGSTLHCINGNPGSEAASFLSNCSRTPPW